MNLVGGGEGCVGVAGRAETRLCTGSVMELGTLMMLGAREALLTPCGACDSVSVGRGWREETDYVRRARRRSVPCWAGGPGKGLSLPG